MKLENQVVSLDLAKRLKELGVEQDSLWYWHAGERGSFIDHHIYAAANDMTEHYSAFTVAELEQIYYDRFGLMWFQGLIEPKDFANSVAEQLIKMLTK